MTTKTETTATKSLTTNQARRAKRDKDHDRQVLAVLKAESGGRSRSVSTILYYLKKKSREGGGDFETAITDKQARFACRRLVEASLVEEHGSSRSTNYSYITGQRRDEMTAKELDRANEKAQNERLIELAGQCGFEPDIGYRAITLDADDLEKALKFYAAAAGKGTVQVEPVRRCVSMRGRGEVRYQCDNMHANIVTDYCNDCVSAGRGDAKTTNAKAKDVAKRKKKVAKKAQKTAAKKAAKPATVKSKAAPKSTTKSNNKNSSK